MRLSLYLARGGVCSRRAAETLIADGKVSVNGQIITQMGTQVPDGAKVHAQGKLVTIGKPAALWLVNKPVGVITTHKDPEGRTTIWEFLATKAFPVSEHKITIGRLDISSEGLLLITNDGAWAERVARSNWPRTYRVRVRGPQVNWARLAKGITIDGIHYQPIHVEEERDGVDGNRWVRVTLTEGKNREIRKVMEHLRLQVSRLIRISFGPYHLEKLGKGVWCSADIYDIDKPNERP